MIFMQIAREIGLDLRRADVWIPWLQSGLRVLLILAGAWLFMRITRRLLGRLYVYAAGMISRHGAVASGEMEKRAATLVAVLRLMTGSLIWIVALVMALTELGFKIEPLLASLGVAGLALGLGAQTLIKDWLGGLFLLLEDQIRIGDVVSVNNVAGVVEEINLRTTVLRAENGALHIVANGSIAALANLSREFSYYVFETTLAHRADADRALAILQESGAEITREEPFHSVILAQMEVMGVDRLGDRGALIRARIKTLPSQQYTVGRELNRRVKQRFDTAGIAFPPPP